jgi:hypothetical protein
MTFGKLASRIQKALEGLNEKMRPQKWKCFNFIITQHKFGSQCHDRYADRGSESHIAYVSMTYADVC